MNHALLHKSVSLASPHYLCSKRRAHKLLVRSMSSSSMPQREGPCQVDVDLEQEDLFKKWRANVGLCVVNSQGLVFAAQRTDTAKHTWQMPQGKQLLTCTHAHTFVHSHIHKVGQNYMYTV